MYDLHLSLDLSDIDVEIPTQYETTIPLLLAAKNSNVRHIRYLLYDGADINAIDEDGNNILVYATYRAKSIPRLSYILKHYPDTIKAKNKYGQTILHWQVQYFNLPVLKFLIDKGADINAVDINGNTPLHIASYNDYYYENIEELISRGADTTIKNKKGQTAFDITNDQTCKDLICRIKLDVEKRV